MKPGMSLADVWGAAGMGRWLSLQWMLGGCKRQAVGVWRGHSVFPVTSLGIWILYNRHWRARE